MKDQLKYEQQVSYGTLEGGEIPKDFLMRYKLYDEEPKPFLINEFKSIGYSDPFPEDFKQITGSISDCKNEAKCT